MASLEQRKAYIAKDGEILYGEEKDQYLLNGSDDSAEFHKHTGMYVKGGHILCGRAAKKEKLTDDVREAIEKSGMSKWLDKLENEAKEKQIKKRLERKRTDQTSKSINPIDANSRNSPSNNMMDKNCNQSTPEHSTGTEHTSNNFSNNSSAADNSNGTHTRGSRGDATDSTNSHFKTSNDDKQLYDSFHIPPYTGNTHPTDDKTAGNRHNGDNSDTCDFGYNSGDYPNALHPGNTSQPTSSAVDAKKVHHRPRHLNEMQVLLQPGVFPPPSASRMRHSNQEHHADVVGHQETAENYSLLDEELHHKLSLAFPQQEGDTRKKTTKSTSYEETTFKQKLTDGLIKVRKQLEVEEEVTATDPTNSTLPDSTEKPKDGDKTLSTSHGSYTSKTDEEVPIPEEKKLPFGSSKNIFTMDSIRNSTYKVQESKKSIKKIHSNVVGFQ